ncbi:serine protein kinase [Aspergillus insuetus]
MRRFKRIYDVVEPVEEYRLGGYHPVHLDDIFNQRYKIWGKMGFGQFSTVWLAQDQLLERQVALKYSRQLLGSFKHDGPNGSQLCLVLPAMLSDGKEMTVTGRPHNAAYIRTNSKQLFIGLDLLHSRNLVHCANVMISTGHDNSCTILLDPPGFSPIQWLEEMTMDNSAPKYLILWQRRRGQLDGADFSELLVKIEDLGGDRHRKAEIDQLYRINSTMTNQSLLQLYVPPKLIRQQSWGSSIDIWALSCIIFELATNEPLFPLRTFVVSKEQIDEEHLDLISRLLGDKGDVDETLIHRLRDRRPSDFGTTNTQGLASFLWAMLQQDPQKRGSTAELLHQPFLTQQISENGKHDGEIASSM